VDQGKLTHIAIPVDCRSDNFIVNINDPNIQDAIMLYERLLYVKVANTI
jgi:hypothetical protein